MAQDLVDRLPEGIVVRHSEHIDKDEFHFELSSIFKFILIPVFLNTLKSIFLPCERSTGIITIHHLLEPFSANVRSLLLF